MHVLTLIYLVVGHYFPELTWLENGRYILCGSFVCTIESTLIDFYDVRWGYQQTHKTFIRMLPQLLFLLFFFFF